MPFALPAIGLAAKLTGVKKFLANVPWQVWAVIALVIATGVGSCVHQSKVKAFGIERYKTGYSAGRASRDAEIWALQSAKAESDRKLAIEIRKRVNAENARISRTADNLLVRGPGKATCPNPPAARSSAGGHNAGTAEADASRPGMPSANWAAVPWDWLVRKAKEFDELLVEDKAWREQKAAEEKAYRESHH